MSVFQYVQHLFLSALATKSKHGVYAVFFLYKSSDFPIALIPFYYTIKTAGLSSVCENSFLAFSHNRCAVAKTAG